MEFFRVKCHDSRTETGHPQQPDFYAPVDRRIHHCLQGRFLGGPGYYISLRILCRHHRLFFLRKEFITYIEHLRPVGALCVYSQRGSLGERSELHFRSRWERGNCEESPAMSDGYTSLLTIKEWCAIVEMPDFAVVLLAVLTIYLQCHFKPYIALTVLSSGHFLNLDSGKCGMSPIYKFRFHLFLIQFR